MRKLASIQEVVSVHSIEGANAIETIQVLGWYLVAKKGEFGVGAKVVYCEVDSILPERPEFEFLRARHFRIKTIKLRGQISQGLALPLSILPPKEDGTEYELDEDVTDVLGVTKWEPAVGGGLGSNAPKGNFPSWIPKTDETRVQSVPWVLDEFRGVEFVATEKVDGSSMTVFARFELGENGERSVRFGVCSRNLEITRGDDSRYWSTALSLGLEDKLTALVLSGDFPDGIAVQGELAGPGIQGNKYALRSHELLVFNVLDPSRGEYLSHDEFVTLTRDKLGLKTCPVVSETFVLDGENLSVNDLVRMANRKSSLNPSTDAEGLVFRPKTERQHRRLGRVSFKVISPTFLLKNDE